jgi:hypothetical protein
MAAALGDAGRFVAIVIRHDHDLTFALVPLFRG